MTKRILAMLLALAMVFALAACAKDETPEAPGTTDPAAPSGPSAPADPGSNGPSEPAPSPNGPAVQGAAGTGGAGQQVTEEEHVYTEITVGSLAGKFVGHFDASAGFSMDVSGSSMTLVYDRMFFIDPDTREWDTEIFSEYSMGEDNVARLTIKEGVTFGRSGNQLLAEDLLFSMQRSATSPMAGRGWAQNTDLANCVISEDGMSIEIPFNMPYGPWCHQLSIMGIIEKSWIEENGGPDAFDWFDPNLANGTGPYLATSYETAISTVYEKRDDWWGEEDYTTTAYCYADKITCLQYTDETTLMVDYENKNLDLVLSLSTGSMERIINDGNIGTAQSVSSNCVAMLVMNYDIVDGNPIFENENLRKAICYGADWNAIAELCYGVLYNPAESIIQQTSPFAASGYAYQYDPELAAQYMADSGLTDVTLKWVVNAGTPAAVFAEAFAAYMDMIGITVNVEIYDTLTCIGMWETPGATDFQLVNNNNANPSGDPFSATNSISRTNSFHCANRQDDAINDLINGSMYTFDPAVRADYYNQLQEYCFNDYSIIPTCEWNVGLAYNDTILSTRITDVYQPNLRYLEF